MNPVKATTRLLFVAALLAGTLQAQPIDREMYAKVAGMNNKRNCPRHELAWTVNMLSYKSGYLHFDLTLKELFAEGRDSADLRRYFADRLRYRLEPVEFNYLYEKLGDIKGGFVYDITIDSSDARLTLHYSPSEARQIWADRTKPEYKNGKKWQGRENIRYINNSNNRNIWLFLNHQIHRVNLRLQTVRLRRIFGLDCLLLCHLSFGASHQYHRQDHKQPQDDGSRF